MEVKTLYTLISVVNHRSFAEAGRAMGMSTSGVSLQIRALEEEFGLVLFDRTTRPPTLTPKGKVFVTRARELLAVWEAMSEGLRSDSAAGILELGAVHTVVSGVLPAALRRLHEGHPKLQIRLTTGLSHELEAALNRGTLDAAVITEPVAVPHGYTFLPVCREPLVVIASAKVQGQTDEVLLKAGPFIRFKRFARVGRIIEEELQRRGIKVAAPMEVDNLEGIFGLVGEGIGISVVPRRCVRQPFPSGVRAVPFGQPPVTRSMGLLMADDTPRKSFVHSLHRALLAASGVSGLVDLSNENHKPPDEPL